jgi:hypothetical protein
MIFETALWSGNLRWSSQDLVDSTSTRAVAEGDADVHEGERGASPFDVRVHQGQ